MRQRDNEPLASWKRHDSPRRNGDSQPNTTIAHVPIMTRVTPTLYHPQAYWYKRFVRMDGVGRVNTKIRGVVYHWIDPVRVVLLDPKFG
jgi:hypothetical protein